MIFMEYYANMAGWKPRLLPINRMRYIQMVDLLFALILVYQTYDNSNTIFHFSG